MSKKAEEIANNLIYFANNKSLNNVADQQMLQGKALLVYLSGLSAIFLLETLGDHFTRMEDKFSSCFTPNLPCGIKFHFPK